MASGKEAPGTKTVNRITDRLDRSQLQRQAMPGGGAVYRGPVASRALEALGARAMTVDQQIIVQDDFDPSKPEDRALFAHEQHHVEHGDGGAGGGGENFRDAEEIAARAVERMVLHRAEGGDESGFQPGTGPHDAPVGSADSGGRGAAAGVQGGQGAPDAGERQSDASRGYKSLQARGMNHADIVDDMARRTMSALEERHQVGFDRQSDKRGPFSST